jgi:hypothetical protein
MGAAVFLGSKSGARSLPRSTRVEDTAKSLPAHQQNHLFSLQMVILADNPSTKITRKKRFYLPPISLA